MQERTVTKNRSSFKEMSNQIVQIKDHVNVIKGSIDKTNLSSDQLVFAMQNISAVSQGADEKIVKAGYFW